MEHHQILKEFLSNEELRGFLRLVEDNSQLFTEVSRRGNLGPRYGVIDGLQIRSSMPELVELWDRRVLPLAERVAGRPVCLLRSERRSIRVQRYTRLQHGFRWHFDGHSYAALVTLKNTNRGETQYVSPLLSRFMPWLLYPLYPFPKLFSLCPHRSIPVEPGDLILMRGGDILHRGVTLGADGERILIVYAYDPVDKKPNVLRDRVARWLNY